MFYNSETSTRTMYYYIYYIVHHHSLTQLIVVSNTSAFSSHLMASLNLQDGISRSTSARKSFILEYRSRRSKWHAFWSFRKHTGHKNSGWFIASWIVLLAFMEQLKKVQCCIPNRWQISWDETWNKFDVINNLIKKITFITENLWRLNDLIEWRHV